MPRDKDMLRVRAIYGRPLVKRAVSDENIEEAKQAALNRVAPEAIREIQREIDRSSWKSSPTELKESFEWEVGESQVVIKSDHPAAHYINDGVRPYQMTHLTKAERPIPIITDDGDVIFRWATEQSMREGKWQHPGIKGKHFIERGVQNARDKVMDEVKKSIREEFVKAFHGK